MWLSLSRSSGAGTVLGSARWQGSAYEAAQVPPDPRLVFEGPGLQASGTQGRRCRLSPGLSRASSSSLMEDVLPLGTSHPKHTLGRLWGRAFLTCSAALCKSLNISEPWFSPL